ncbi:hypothetical protein [Rhodoligotrophos ferricapiens]|uniref:hypothetical protein n=1 Tax=Rhodoligotrophos ferricapiens TaxID=3069264 RepID=UPI00315C9817
MTNDPISILSDLYTSEINWRIATSWETGFRATLGDGSDGIFAQSDFRTMEEAVDFLAKHAIRFFPNSTFANKHSARYYSQEQELIVEEEAAGVTASPLIQLEPAGDKGQRAG